MRVAPQVQAEPSAFPEGFHLSMMHVDMGTGCDHIPAFCASAGPEPSVCAGFKPPDEIGGEHGWMLNFPFIRFKETGLPFVINGKRWHASSCAAGNFQTERPDEINDDCANLNTVGHPSHKPIQRFGNGAACPFCRHVLTLTHFFCSIIQGAQKHGKELLSSVRNTDMGAEQMWEKLGMLAKQKGSLRLEALNDSRKIIRLEKSLDDHKRLLRAIADCELPRVHQIIRIGIDHGDTAHAISQRIHKATRDLHKMHASNDDKDLSLLTLRIGGPFHLYAHQHAGHLPGKDTAKRHSRTLLSGPFRVSKTAQADLERPTLQSNVSVVASEPENGALVPTNHTRREYESSSSCDCFIRYVWSRRSLLRNYDR